MGYQLRNTGGARALPINLLGQATRWLSRAEQEDLIERLIAHIDSMDGDSDIELNGDEADGGLGEDDFHMHHDCTRYPGCPCSDPAEDDDSDFCLAGDDGVFAGPAVIADVALKAIAQAGYRLIPTAEGPLG